MQPVVDGRGGRLQRWMFVPLTLPSPATILTVSTFSRAPKGLPCRRHALPGQVGSTAVGNRGDAADWNLGHNGMRPAQTARAVRFARVLLVAECSLPAFPLCTIQVLMIMMGDAITPSTHVSAGTGDS